MTAISDAPSTLDLGRVIQQLFSVLGRNIATFGVLAVIMVGVPTAILYGVMGTLLTSTTPPSSSGRASDGPFSAPGLSDCWA